MINIFTTSEQVIEAVRHLDVEINPTHYHIDDTFSLVGQIETRDTFSMVFDFLKTKRPFKRRYVPVYEGLDIAEAILSKHRNIECLYWEMTRNKTCIIPSIESVERHQLKSGLWYVWTMDPERFQTPMPNLVSIVYHKATDRIPGYLDDGEDYIVEGWKSKLLMDTPSGNGWNYPYERGLFEYSSVPIASYPFLP